MLFMLFSIAGFCNVTTDLSKDSNHQTEVFSFADVSKIEMVSSVSRDFKAVVFTGFSDKVPILLKEASYYNTNATPFKTLYVLQEVEVCTRDKLRF